MKRFSLDPELSEVGAARRFVRSELSATPPDVTSDMQLIVSELVSNAIEHGAVERVALELDVSPTDVVLSVTSHGDPAAVPSVDAWAIAPADDTSGRGLGIVRSLADAVQVIRDGPRLSITVRRRV